MTTITVHKTDTGSYKSFASNGHAEYADFGSDIVCAAISVLIVNAINSIETLVPNEHFTVKTEQVSGTISFKFEKEPLSETALLLDSLILGLKEIEKQYGKKYLKLIFRRYKPC